MADIPSDADRRQALLRLMTWLSPAFPVGAFSYSGGLEQAIAGGQIADANALRDWISVLITAGGGWNDAVLLVEAHRAAGDPSALAAVSALAEAMAGSRERHQETMLQGNAFLMAARAWPHPVLDVLDDRAAYPVAVGAVSGAHGIDAGFVLTAYFQAMAGNLVSVAIRCGLTGQVKGIGVLAALESDIAAAAEAAAVSTLDDLGSATVLADIAALRHETMVSRLFRS